MLYELDPQEVIESLTEKQTEVLELLVQHNTTKQIARQLGISPSTVDQRILAVRDKWGTIDRNETARYYAHFLEMCGKSPCGFSQVELASRGEHEPHRELPRSPIFEVADVHASGPWFETETRGWVLEAFDARFGKFGRIVAIVVLAMAIAVTVVASLAMAQALGKYL